MSFRFSSLCDLLDELYYERHHQRTTYARRDDPRIRIVTRWYSKHNARISRTGPSAIAFLSCLFPERRPDRVYHVRETRLSFIFGRALGLGASRLQSLLRWQENDGDDFPSCIEKVVAECEPDQSMLEYEVTLDEIDDMFNQFAAVSLASSSLHTTVSDETLPEELLGRVIRRLSSTQAKWLARMFLKSFSPVEIPEYAALCCFHFMLPKLLTVQNCFSVAIATLAQPELCAIPYDVKKDYQAALMPVLEKMITPQLGIMIQRQPYDKARSIKHCVKMAGSRTMSVERKYDGEYCQLHINLESGSRSVQIFSKSGKDSTSDRFALLNAIKSSLKLNIHGCKIKKHAILEGELVVYSRSKRQILPFYHVRKHVLHGGRRIGGQADSPRKGDETLMVVFFDLLLLDDRLLLNEPHKTRRSYLKAVVTRIPGLADICEHKLIHFGSRKASSLLRETFAKAIRHRWEGCVLKGSEDPYFSWRRSARAIKLKKDYIAGLGDSADLCIIGGRRDSRVETELNIGKLSYTHFYIAAITNRNEVKRFGSKPKFKVIDTIGPGGISKDDILALNLEGRFMETSFVSDSEYMKLELPRKDMPVPSIIFKSPFVTEIMGAGYERPQGVNFYVLRFPRRAGTKIKIHRDRDVADTISFDELQTMAECSLHESADVNSQEDAQWIAKLEAADPKVTCIENRSQSTSPAKTQRSVSTVDLTPAPIPTQDPPSAAAPTFIRVDTSELTLKEKRARYPKRYETPERESEPTPAPSSANSPPSSRSDGTKRVFADITGPTLHVSNKRLRAERSRHVTFADDIGEVDTREKTMNAKVRCFATLIGGSKPLSGNIRDDAFLAGVSVSVAEPPSANGVSTSAQRIKRKSYNTMRKMLLPSLPLTPPPSSEARSSLPKCHGRPEQRSDGSLQGTTATGQLVAANRDLSLSNNIIQHVTNLTSTRNLSSADIKSLIERVTTNVVIVPSLSASFSKNVDAADSIHRIKAAAVHSLQSFAESVFAPRRPVDMAQIQYAILIDSHQPRETAKDLQALSSKLTSRSITHTDIRSSIDIDVYDWHVLLSDGAIQSFHARHNASESPSAESHFYAMLRLTRQRADIMRPYDAWQVSLL